MAEVRQVNLTERQQHRLIWEVITMVDVDTLQDNLDRVDYQAPEGTILSDDLQAIADLLDDDGRYGDEWASLTS